MPGQLRAFQESAAQHRGAVLAGHVPGKQPLMDRSRHLPPQRLGDGGDQVGYFTHVHSRRLPGRAVQGVAEHEQQPRDLDLRLDPDHDVTHAGRADLPGGADKPAAGDERRRHRAYHAGGGEQPPLIRGKRTVRRRPELVQLQLGHDGSGVPIAARRLGSPYWEPMSAWP
jgi:hypothetical protein